MQQVRGNWVGQEWNRRQALSDTNTGPKHAYSFAKTKVSIRCDHGSCQAHICCWQFTPPDGFVASGPSGPSIYAQPLLNEGIFKLKQGLIFHLPTFFLVLDICPSKVLNKSLSLFKCNSWRARGSSPSPLPMDSLHSNRPFFTSCRHTSNKKHLPSLISEKKITYIHNCTNLHY